MSMTQSSIITATLTLCPLLYWVRVVPIRPFRSTACSILQLLLLLLSIPTSTTKSNTITFINMNYEDFDDTNNRDFVGRVLESDSTCISYLGDMGLFTTILECLGGKGVHCGGTMVPKMRNSVPIWRCPKSKCNTTRSLSSKMLFLVSPIVMAEAVDSEDMLM